MCLRGGGRRVGRGREFGAPPTLEEIRDHFGWRAIGTVLGHVRALLKKGYLWKERGARSLRARREEGAVFPREDGLRPSRGRSGETSGKVLPVPVVGEVAAGSPILAVENVEESWFIDRELLKGEDNFLLRVKGESMRDAQVRDGDYVLVKPQGTAENGEIVVARAGDEVTVKHFHRMKSRIELRSANPAFRSLVFKPGGGEVEIVGKVIGVLRRY